MTSGAIWYIYLLECAGGSLYTGITTDVEARFRVIASRPVGSRAEALRAEFQIKRLSKDRKLAALNGSAFHLRRPSSRP